MGNQHLVNRKGGRMQCSAGDRWSPGSRLPRRLFFARMCWIPPVAGCTMGKVDIRELQTFTMAANDRIFTRSLNLDVAESYISNRGLRAPRHRAWAAATYPEVGETKVRQPLQFDPIVNRDSYRQSCAVNRHV